jgi:lipopolysaccharide export system protein LptC
MTLSHQAMDLWGPRRATSLREARRRTGFVHIIRLLFTSGAVVAAGFLLGPAIQHAFSTAAPPANGPALSVTILNPRFEGRDANDRPYVITADTARRRRENVALIDLVNPHLADETSTNVYAREGVFDRSKQILDLVGDVVMTDAAGYTFRAEKARMFVEENRVEGQTPLKGVGPIGELTGDTYEVLDSGDRIIVSGHVQSRFVRRPRDAAAAPDGGE